MTKNEYLTILVEMISTYHMYDDVFETAEALGEHYGTDNYIDNFYRGFDCLSKEDLMEVIWYLLNENMDYAIDDILELLNANIEDNNYRHDYDLENIEK